MYNSYARLPGIPYKIMEYLANSPDADDLWLMLKYNDYYALDKVPLSFGEKMSLVWRTGPQEKYGVFLTPLVEDAISESKSIMSIKGTIFFIKLLSISVYHLIHYIIIYQSHSAQYCRFLQACICSVKSGIAKAAVICQHDRRLQ